MQADRKADVKKGADKAEADISFRMDEMEGGKDMDDLEGTGTRLKVKCPTEPKVISAAHKY